MNEKIGEIMMRITAVEQKVNEIQKALCVLTFTLEDIRYDLRKNAVDEKIREVNK